MITLLRWWANFTTGVTHSGVGRQYYALHVKNPALYMQAAFRAQNPCLFNRDGKFLRKENSYVLILTACTLTIFEELVNDLLH